MGGERGKVERWSGLVQSSRSYFPDKLFSLGKKKPTEIKLRDD